MSKPVQAFAAEGLSTSRVSPRRATYFSLLRQRNLRKRKATLLSASPFANATGATCGARQKRGLARTRLRLRQSRALIRFCLRSSAQPDGWRTETENQYQFGEARTRFARPRRSPIPNPFPTPPPFCMRRGAQGQTDKDGRLSERSEFEPGPGWTEHRRLPP